MKSSFRLILAIFFTLVLRSGLPLEAAPLWENHFAKAPSAMLTHANPYTGDPGAVRAGKKLFERHCSECHGHDAEGIGRAPSLKTDSVRDAAPGALLWFLQKGDLRHGMPSWSQLPNPMLWQVITYLRMLP